MQTGFRFRRNPTAAREQIFPGEIACRRFIFNAIVRKDSYFRTIARKSLRVCSDGWRNGERIGYPATDKALIALKATPEHAWLQEVSSVCPQQALRDLQVTFSNFFDKRAAYPSFKRKEARQSANYTERGFSFDPATRTLKLAKIGAIKVKWSRGAIPHPSSSRLIRTASGKYFVSLVVETQPAPLPQTGEAAGIDLGVARLATLSNGERIANPKHGAKWQRRVAFYQKRLARCQKGSKRRAHIKRHVARIHEKIANSRSDTLHKLSINLVTRFDTICVEDLNLRGLVKNHSMARAVSDASIGAAIRMIENKAERLGKTVVRIDRWYPSSKTCSACGHIVETLPLSVREWKCPECGTTHDRDANAAANILAVGHTVSAHGGTVRRSRATASERKSPRSANRQGVDHA